MAVSEKLIKERKAYLFNNSCADRILEEYHDREYSQFICYTAGDVFTFRVYGSNPRSFELYEK